MATFEFSEDENTVTLAGRRYVAVTGTAGLCTDCAFRREFGCDLFSAVYKENIADSRGARCQSYCREDGRDIIWRLPIRL